LNLEEEKTAIVAADTKTTIAAATDNFNLKVKNDRHTPNPSQKIPKTAKPLSHDDEINLTSSLPPNFEDRTPNESNEQLLAKRPKGWAKDLKLAGLSDSD